jgi:predicted transcriptional regulator
LNQDAIMAALPALSEEARSIREIAQAMGLEISTRNDWIKIERSLTRTLRRLIRWGVVACERRQNTGSNRFWYNVYWRAGMMAPEQAIQEVV